jgi:hypothetical protein
LARVRKTKGRPHHGLINTVDPDADWNGRVAAAIGLPTHRIADASGHRQQG